MGSKAKIEEGRPRWGRWKIQVFYGRSWLVWEWEGVNVLL